MAARLGNVIFWICDALATWAAVYWLWYAYELWDATFLVTSFVLSTVLVVIGRGCQYILGGTDPGFMWRLFNGFFRVIAYVDKHWT